MPNAISSKHSFTHFHPKTPPFNSTHSHYHFSFSHTSLIPHIHITTLIHTNTLFYSIPFYYHQYTLRTNTHTTIDTLNTPFTPISLSFIIYKPIPSTHTLHTLLLPISFHSFYLHSPHTLFHTSITYTLVLTYSTHSSLQFHSIPSPFHTIHHTHSNSIQIIPFHTLINNNHTQIPIYHISHFTSIHSYIHSSSYTTTTLHTLLSTFYHSPILISLFQPFIITITHSIILYHYPFLFQFYIYSL